MDDQANDSAEAVAEFDQSELEEPIVSQAFSLPAFNIWGRFLLNSVSEPDSAVKPPKHKLDKLDLLKATAPFIILAIILAGLLTYIGLGYLKDSQESRATDRILANIKPDQFNQVSALTYESANPYSSTNSQIDKLTHQAVVFTVGQQTVTASASDIATWLTISTDITRHKTAILINKQAISDYINKLATTNTHQVVNADKMFHSDGTVLVISNGQQGESVSGAQSAISTVEAGLMAGGGLNVNLPASYTPYQTITTSPFDKMIEVNITTKQMYIYEGNNLINTFPVSAGAPLTPTPIGTFHIYEKLAVQNMSGFNYDGTPYFQPNVPYVNYFYGADAIHGNYWRPLSWFGNINSSHGCVGVSVSNGKWIYDWAPIGTTVIVHK